MWPFASSSSSSQSLPGHPYFPRTAAIAGGYEANQLSTPTLLSLFSGYCTAILAVGYVLARRYPAKRGLPALSKSDVAAVLWWSLCAGIHTFFEGYYATNFRAMGKLQSIFGQLWKEYSLSDSRYLTKDGSVLCIESITAFCWGPLSFLIVYLITTDHPLRHPLQLLVATGQLYGTVLYYGIAIFDELVYGKAYSRPEAYYFYGYYVLMNSFWIIFPGLLIYSSFKATIKGAQALKQLQQQEQPQQQPQQQQQQQQLKTRKRL
ncbi:hypothetical protein VTJ04DRAFT_4342 [Mycothermus thermophilus]|uniref:uncharacterized protein n=1 Tax=Humicola insolens TaxID=85995 RepID=UPI00374258B5